jgi:uncharacterized protein
VHLPEVGTAYLPAGGTGPARLRFDGAELRIAGVSGTVVVDPSGFMTESWQPTRRVVLEDGWTVRIEDGDPARKCHRWPSTGRLRDDEEQQWRAALADAWQLIRAEVPGYAPGLRAALRTVVPLLRDESGSQRASTARHAFGSVAAALAEPSELAVMLVHEFQHGKLGAVLELHDLYDERSDARMTVGWRPDPRPVEGVLQGIYAHAAVADIHRARLGRNESAAKLYARYRRWTVEAIAGLRKTGALMPLGEEFVDRVEATVWAWDS